MMSDTINVLSELKKPILLVRKISSGTTLEICTLNDTTKEVDFCVDLGTETEIFSISQKDFPQVIEFLQTELEKINE